MSTAVTTWPWARSLTTPKTGMGAVGWITTMPYRIRSHTPRVRRSVGALPAVTAVVALAIGQREPLHIGHSWHIFSTIQLATDKASTEGHRTGHLIDPIEVHRVIGRVEFAGGDLVFNVNNRLASTWKAGITVQKLY